MVRKIGIYLLERPGLAGYLLDAVSMERSLCRTLLWRTHWKIPV